MPYQQASTLLLITADPLLQEKIHALCMNIYQIETQTQLSDHIQCDAILVGYDKKDIFLDGIVLTDEYPIIYLQQDGDARDSLSTHQHVDEIIDMNKITNSGFFRAINSAIEKFCIKKELRDQKKTLQKLIESIRGTQDKLQPASMENTAQDLIEENKKLIGTIKKQNENLKKLSRIDPLTKVGNRLNFEETLTRIISHAKRHKHMIALLMIDLDKFKNVNDTFGHQAGDLLLQLATQRLETILRKEDFIARLGGDEFAIILNEIKSTHAAGIVAWKIVQEIEKPFLINNVQIHVDVSVGIACYPLVGETFNDLIKNADIAMYQAKKSQALQYAFANMDMQKDHIKKIQLQEELKLAIQNNELHMVYQPIYEIPSKKLHGFEALIRWENKHLGKISPAEFIPIAEDTGLIHPISKWVLESVCQQIQLWQELKIFQQKISINLSPVQLAEKDFLATIKKIISKYQIPLQIIEFEITEMVALENNQGIKDTIKNLCQLGASHALDNFGTGYSGMRYLTFLPLSIIKIDQSFIQGLGVNEADEKIVSAIIALAKKMNLSVVAEGVETEAQLKILIEENCDYAQGFLFSKPLSAVQAEKLIYTESEKK
ncbi:MAG: hypothetical protein COY58_03925 [Gammaproteobacteria bacterium CG_4_10_14_0_8_um_filter_38_16]|nr:MAG: hypothetical protein COY58_03925 [Gammaproteobacteria bacterium CG_4_10_14_0_8_um_filter_38_16]PJA03209.1 MAG: hypothetical protein COX72_06450 [Gammaproteobacteria bacterium CG_4_10_14_0_2_um_filter_38_22]PJB10328.1 MAG: hypothetical protein CO120_05345 [Gammaproteobacteria bacterium CG_4_9_14_3_um_filter_38_9]